MKIEPTGISKINLQVAEIIKNELTTVSYETWLKPIENAYMKSNNIVIETDNLFHKEILEQRYLKLLDTAFSQFINELNYSKIIIKVRQPISQIENKIEDTPFQLISASEIKKIADLKNEEKIEVDATVQKILIEISNYIDVSASKGEYSTSYIFTKKCNAEVFKRIIDELNNKGYKTDFIKDMNIIMIEWK